MLVVDDEEASRTGLGSLVSTWGFEVVEAANGAEALEQALAFRPDLVITDLVMPGLDGLDLLKALRADLPGASVIVLTGNATIETAVAAMKEGAYDYMSKPVDVRRLRVLVDKAVERADVAREVDLLRRQLKESRGLGPLLGSSPSMQEVFHQIELAGPTGAPVLVLGENGTGKELVARTIHQLSPRARLPFVAVNCAAIPESLLESELLGHERGAFTGALERRAGYFELADGGTIFLDEIAEMSPPFQAKYLRILQDGIVRRIGGKNEIKVDVRVVAATNKDPLAAIRAGEFREDLYYRLNVFTIAMPPMRQRMEDLPLLVEAFIAEFATKYDKRVRAVGEAALRVMTRHAWPGNVRELRNCIERAVVACDAETLAPEHLPFRAAVASPADRPDALTIPLGTTVDRAERELILRTLESVGNNKTRAAEVLGISIKTLHNKLNRYNAAAAAGS
ncbi:MAG TPA: sigma-54 dependent transcriptional regulator [Candidatus Binatia bacterium]|nr:sigma-54 dependent transcriptional regulator [Candidatus Binatia bacterium]